MKYIKKKIIVACMMISVMTAESLSAAATQYYNTYSVVNSDIANSTYSSQQGMCIDRFNGEAYFIRKSDSGRAQLVTCSYKKSVTPTVLKGSSGETSSKIFGHGNDIEVIAESGDTQVALYIATMDEGSCANKVIKLEVDRKKHTYKKVGEYTLNGDASVSGITYSVGNKKFILKSQGKFHIGNFSGDEFVTEATFKIDCSAAKIDGKTEDCSKYTGQGICFYKGILYTPLWNEKGGKKNQSVVLCYDLDVNKKSYPDSLEPMSNLSFRITSSKYSTFEIEDVGLASGVMYFNTNCNSNNDLLGSFKNYVAAD